MSTITLTLKNYRCFASPATIEIQKGFTAFVGVNNAGKSAVMRFLLEFRPLLTQLTNIHFLHGAIISPSDFNPFLHVLDQEEAFSNLNTNPIEIAFMINNEQEDADLGYRRLDVTAVVDRDHRVRLKIAHDGTPLRGYSGHAENKLMVGGRPKIKVSQFTDTMASLANSLYIGPFRNTINIGTKSDYLDIQIGESFITHFRDLKTGPSKRANTNVSALTDQIKQIFRFDSLDISPTPDNSSLHITVNGKPFKQHELGSGLSHFIIVLANAAVKRPNWILVDEPEMNLHPSLQLEFLTALGTYGREGVWFSTHSLGLARTAAELVYSVSKEYEGNSKIKNLSGTPRPAEFLGEMSFSSQKEIGFEKILLVEGPTEVKAIQQFLRMIGKDHSILLMPIHGHMPKADELEEILRITTNVAALIDSEKESAGAELNQDRREFEELCKSRKLPCHVLERRAIENYFTDGAIKNVFGEKYRSLEPYEKLSNVNPHWSKNENWKLAAAMKFEGIRDSDLGNFLESL